MQGRSRAQFRMALLSGEVETPEGIGRNGPCWRGSGWLCYPGKLKLKVQPCSIWECIPRFRMALLSGEVETLLGLRAGGLGGIGLFRMALLSGEVETSGVSLAGAGAGAFRMALLSGEVETAPLGQHD